MSRSKNKRSAPSSAPSPAGASAFWRGPVPWACLVAVGIIVGAVAWKKSQAGKWTTDSESGRVVDGGGKGASASAVRFRLEPEEKVFAQYAGSASCKECHQEAYAKWKSSHHGLAERKVDAALDKAAFDPVHNIKHGTQSSEARTSGGKLQLVTVGAKGAKEAFTPERVIGVDPLRQFLIGTDKGRYQTAELTWDPHKQEWFNVFGDEDRRPGEWGHWTGRGMNWNQMCASCHNTRVRKNYEPATDSYHTSMAEMTVSCEACHGPMRDHVDWQKQYTGKPGDPTLKHFSLDQITDTCGSCHARRGEITGDFKPGERFFDHFALTIPDETDIFHADGQVRDEDYEFTSFLSSKMHTAGVRCRDCHDSHSGKNLIVGDLLCLRCHGATPTPTAGLQLPAPRIDPAMHTFHKADTAGSRCVDCHMPITTYMQRHPRRDHGFTIPDPLLTKQLGIPNACNRCHQDKSVDWALQECDRMYGKKMERPTRARAQAIAAARTNAPNAEAALLRMLTDEKTPLWRATAAGLLRNWSYEPNVAAALTRVTKDTNELVRATAARALEQPASQGDASARGVLAALLDDPSRNVRVDAAWVLRAKLDTNSLAGQELAHQLALNLDQPLGQFQWGNYLAERGDHAGALASFKRAVEWDGGSPPLRQAYAVELSRAGQPREAVKQLAEAIRVSPRDAELRFTYALALHEAGQVNDATTALEEAVKLAPQFSRAWYNLGLAYNAQGKIDEGLDALSRAESLDRRNPDIPYAAATILAKQQRLKEARDAAQRALRAAPGYGPAQQLLQVLSQQ